MLFFADISIFAWPSFKTRRSHLNDINIIFEFSFFLLKFRDFEGSEWVFSFPGSNIRAKKH